MDPIGLAGAALGAGVSAGLALIAATVAGVSLLRPADAGAAPDLGGPLYLLLAGTLGGIALAGLTTWKLLRPVPSTYRRAGLAMVSAFATVPLMLVCLPVDRRFGGAGLGALALLAAAGAALLWRRARRLERAP